MKICTDCKKEKEMSEFSSNKTKKDGKNFRCKECQRIYFKSYYEKNKKKHLDSVKSVNKEYFKKLKEILDEIKTKCCICGYFENKKALVFHHLDKKTKDQSIAQMRVRKFPIQKILKEIEKCVVICCNCHAILHN